MAAQHEQLSCRKERIGRISKGLVAGPAPERMEPSVIEPSEVSPSKICAGNGKILWQERDLEWEQELVWDGY